MSGIRPGGTPGPETFLTLRGPHETDETVDPAARRLGAHADLLRRAYLPGPGSVVAGPRRSGGVHGHAGLPVQHHGISQDALGFLPRLQPAVQRDAAAARPAALAARWHGAERPGPNAPADRDAVRRLPRV